MAAKCRCYEVKYSKAGVHISTVYGEFSEQFRGQVAGAEEDPRFWAAGISVIAHPANPHAPTAHMNTWMVVTKLVGRRRRPTLMLAAARTPVHDDTRDFHAAFKSACDAHDAEYYPRFKAECDDYFFLPHRKETRGTGGFLRPPGHGRLEADFAFTQDVGRAFVNIYPKITARRPAEPFTEEDRQNQMRQRGRYVEFTCFMMRNDARA